MKIDDIFAHSPTDAKFCEQNSLHLRKKDEQIEVGKLADTANRKDLHYAAVTAWFEYYYSSHHEREQGDSFSRKSGWQMSAW